MGSNQAETVYCDFTKGISDPAFQKWIGYQDVKSKPVYFHVQYTEGSADTAVPIRFENAVYNTGNGMTIETGEFKAPVKGTYFFSFASILVFIADGRPLTLLNIYKIDIPVAVSG
ncbi:uncharacterized protein LOC116927210 [Daphnia magna]|uniref:uncharacterized protein LOC116927210 n=1 Tax=Daphnia magna TaxID=35525 RepID=UPI001E1BCB3F|nr:uncharacterized protein LOC116927210 [Daphnia magna]